MNLAGPITAVTLAGALCAQPALAKPAYENPRLPVRERVADLLPRMTLAEKVGQMTQAERGVVADTSPITELGLGSVLSGGGSVADAEHPEGLGRHGRPLPARRARHAAAASRMLYGIDSVHGHGNLLGATVFPHNIGLGATRDPRLVREVEHITAEETRATGPQWSFAPCVCAARDDRWGRTYESFGEDPGLVIRMETAIDGLQGAPRRARRPDRVLATAKHYAGDGDTVYGTGGGAYPIDQGVAVTSRKDVLRATPCAVRAGGARSPRGQRDALVLERGLDRGRGRQPGEDAREPRADHRRAQGKSSASTAS